MFSNLPFYISSVAYAASIQESYLVAARWTYNIYYSGTADISQTGHLHPITYWVQNWPTISILESSMEKLFGIALVDFTAKWAIILLQFLLLVPIYLFFKNTIDRTNFRWAACCFFIWLIGLHKSIFHLKHLVYFS